MFQVCRPVGRLFYWALAVVLVSGVRVAGSEEGSAAKPGGATSFTRSKPAALKLLARAASPTFQSGPSLTNVIDTVYRADGTQAQGVLVITWPAFVEANGIAVAEGTSNITLSASGGLNVALVPNAGNQPGAEKKDAAMSFLQNALSTLDAVAAREIIDPEKFKNGVSMIIDGTVMALNASTWCKQPPATNGQPSA